jgi:hypothetical protein
MRQGRGLKVGEDSGAWGPVGGERRGGKKMGVREGELGRKEEVGRQRRWVAGKKKRRKKEAGRGGKGGGTGPG